MTERFLHKVLADQPCLHVDALSGFYDLGATFLITIGKGKGLDCLCPSHVRKQATSRLRSHSSLASGTGVTSGSPATGMKREVR